MLIDEIKNLRSTPKELRKFGVTVGVVLLIISAFLFWKENQNYLYFAYFGAGLALTGLTLPLVLKPLYLAWMTLAIIMGFVMTRVILSVLFFGVFTPAALMAKLLRKDLLSQRWNRSADTYWIKRKSDSFDPSSAEKMF